MKVSVLKVKKITTADTDLLKVLDQYLPKLRAGSVVAVSSKVVAICEGRVVKIGEEDKEELARKEADYYLPPDNTYNFSLAIKNNALIATAGIDESNGNGYYVLWPSNPQKIANEIRAHLAKKYALKNIGVIITDSKTTPQRWGVTGFAIAHSGFAALNDYRGKPDIFGRKLKVTQVNVMDGLAAAAVLVMGEGNEQTPLALIEDIPFVVFHSRNPTNREIAALKISIEEDLYHSLLMGVPWEKK